MKSRTLFLLVIFAITAVTAACSGTQSASTAQVTQSSDTAVTTGSMTIEEKLAVGTLNLEGTDLAVTADEAKTLLPLWKAVKSLSSSDTTAPAELTALYKQIQGSMTTAQVQAIDKMQFTQDDINALMQKMGVQAGGPAANSSQATMTDSERATQIAAIQTQNPNLSSGGNPGNMPGGGSPPGGDAGMAPPSGDLTGQGGPMVQGTPQAEGTPTGQQGSGMNMMFVDTLINLLSERAGS